jgi:hypothetical protein
VQASGRFLDGAFAGGHPEIEQMVVIERVHARTLLHIY